MQNDSQIGATLDALARTIEDRRHATGQSYTHGLLTGKLDSLLKKVSEESLETCLAAKETELFAPEDQPASKDHLRYEAADLIYHLMVLMARFNISNDDLAAELNARMQPDERPEGAKVMDGSHINRGK
ncbi:MAG: phosphoribosyl-ATP diphosphatase [Eggerthellaceae bacterium]|nr:phosphoribosyl-ATP diphosphatase [Eggerthellaceae bacterium]